MGEEGGRGKVFCHTDCWHVTPRLHKGTSPHHAQNHCSTTPQASPPKTLKCNRTPRTSSLPNTLSHWVTAASLPGPLYRFPELCTTVAGARRAPARFGCAPAVAQEYEPRGRQIRVRARRRARICDKSNVYDKSNINWKGNSFIQTQICNWECLNMVRTAPRASMHGAFRSAQRMPTASKAHSPASHPRKRTPSCCARPLNPAPRPSALRPSVRVRKRMHRGLTPMRASTTGANGTSCLLACPGTCAKPCSPCIASGTSSPRGQRGGPLVPLPSGSSPSACTHPCP